MAKRAVKSFVAAGVAGVVKVGNSYPDDHPAVRLNPHLFEEIDAPEQATAAPGERRVLGVRSRAARAAARAEVEAPAEVSAELPVEYECADCGETFTSAQGLGGHRSKHKGEDS